MSYEYLLDEAYSNNVNVKEIEFESSSRGLIKGNIIALRNDISSFVEKACVLAEELGHYYTSYGDILDSSITENRKQEKRARNWSYEKLIPLTGFIKAYKSGVKNRHELAEFFDVTEEFIDCAIIHYQEKYGLYHRLGNYIVYFDPLGIYKMFE